ncbi:Elongation factor P--(R)-beta-lysine ligase [Chlamydiales bacterium STE3]|nr:Elongation factor P--(R)-beta-lysine ligase [Chlamydiales bacterium STE3]
MSLESIANQRLSILRDRAAMLARARTFFSERNVLEVDCPLLTNGASVDAHIDLIPAFYQGNTTRYLHSSPEYGMKRLIVEGMGDIYQLAHVFRDGEHGYRHNPEFCMAEWYRMGIAFEEMIAETLDFIRLFLGPLPSKTYSYRQLFQELGLDYRTATEETLQGFLNERSFHGFENENKEGLLNLVLGLIIEPQLGKEELSVLAYYPASQAALAKTEQREDEQVALRFEIYYRGVELCNGYSELPHAEEQRERFELANAERLRLGKQALPIDEFFLKALHQGLPECCGVAVGFDRLMMLRHQVSSLSEVLSFDWLLA